MVFRNLGRSWLAAAVLALSAVTPLLGAAAPAAAADNVTITVTVRDDGFSQSTVDARVGDYLIFKLDDAAMGSHTLAWEQGQFPFTFSHSPGRNYRKYGGDKGLQAGTLHFYDADHVSGYAAGGPFTGVLTVSDAPPPPPPPPPPSSSSTTTTVTSPPSSATTTTTMAPTTTTTAPGSIQPFLVPDPEPTTTATAAPNPAGSGAGSVKGSGTNATTADKDKDKGKGKAAAAAETSTTFAPAPPAALPDSIFDAESLTPSPTTLPDPQSVGDPDDEAALSAASILSLLDPEKAAADDDNTRLVLLIAAGALGLLVLVGGLWCWGHRASRYDPA
jgi:hypothetical protein